MKIKKILISQPKPETDKSPYLDIIAKHNVDVVFYPFIKVEQLSASEFRKQKVYIQDYSAIIFTSRTAVNHFFKMCSDLRHPVSESLKYFCTSEAIALYTQKYIVFRKRKIFYGKRDFSDLIDIIRKHSCDRFLLPTADVCGENILKILEDNKIKFAQAVFYKTISNDMSQFGNLDFDMLVFFSPEGIKSLQKNYPDFVQGDIRLAAYGANTAQAVLDAGFRLDLVAPKPETPSMATAIDLYISKLNSSKH